MQEFFKWVREDGNPTVSGHDALKAVKIAKAAQLSFEKNKPVRINL